MSDSEKVIPEDPFAYPDEPKAEPKAPVIPEDPFAYPEEPKPQEVQ